MPIIAVDYLSLEAFERITVQPDMVCISIGDPATSLPYNIDKFEHKLRLEFLDIEQEDVDSLGLDSSVAFDRLKLAKLMRFVRQIHSLKDNNYRMIVHCRAGISRSAAVALIIEAMTGCKFPRRQEAVYANRLVVDEYSLETNDWIKMPTQPKIDHRYLPSGELAI